MSKGWLLRGWNGCYTGMEMSYSIEVEGFPSLEERWQELLQARPQGNIFLTPQWQKAWWQELGAERELLLLSVRRGAELVGIAPLMCQGDTISFIGDNDLCDYMDFITCQGQESAFSAVLLDYLEAMKWHSLDLYSLLPYSIALSHFAPLAGERGYLVEITREDVSPQVILPRSWKEYLSQLSGKDRHELRRKLRRLS
ncbi:MAG: GNAT family N-acetyltransferase, partial [Dehalococcoidia bacterium]